MKILDDGRVRSKAVYIAIGVDLNSQEDVLFFCLFGQFVQKKKEKPSFQREIHF